MSTRTKLGKVQRETLRNRRLFKSKKEENDHKIRKRDEKKWGCEGHQHREFNPDQKTRRQRWEEKHKRPKIKRRVIFAE